MSDTKQQCPTSCENHGKPICPWHNYSAPVEDTGEPTSSGSHQTVTDERGGFTASSTPSLPDSPSAGSGAREAAREITNYMQDVHNVKVDPGQISEIVSRHAAHCTAPLREERDTALASADFWERELNNFRRNAAHRAEQLAAEMVTAERTRREAAERERDTSRKTMAFFASVIKSGESWSETCENELRAALRGNGESNG